MGRMHRPGLRRSPLALALEPLPRAHLLLLLPESYVALNVDARAGDETLCLIPLVPPASSHNDPHGERFATWIAEKFGLGTPWTEVRRSPACFIQWPPITHAPRVKGIGFSRAHAHPHPSPISPSGPPHSARLSIPRQGHRPHRRSRPLHCSLRCLAFAQASRRRVRSALQPRGRARVDEGPFLGGARRGTF